jgi:hypothetical protein
MDPDPFSHFKSLDPSRMSVAEVYDALNALSNAQDEDCALLEFNLNDSVVINLISSYSVDQDIVEVPDPGFGFRRGGKGKGGKQPIKNAIRTNHNIPDFSPPSRASPDGPPEAGDRHSPADAARGEREETGSLPPHIIISALQAVAAHDPHISPTPASGVPIAPSPPQHGQRRDRVDEESVSEDDRVKKRVRYEEPRSPREATETEAPLTVNSSRPTSNATTATTGKAAKPKTGTKKSTKAAGVPAPPVRKVRKSSASKVPKPPPPPPARISKRYADFSYNIGKL